MTKLTHLACVAIRMAVQTLAGGGVTAAGLAILHSYGQVLPTGWSVAAAAALTWVAGVSHNALEDHGMIGTWLRQPTLTPAAIVKAGQKAQAAANRQTARLAAQAAKIAPAEAPVLAAAVDPLEAKVDALMATVTQLVASGAANAAAAASPAAPVLPQGQPVPPVPPAV